MDIVNTDSVKYHTQKRLGKIDRQVTKKLLL